MADLNVLCQLCVGLSFLSQQLCPTTYPLLHGRTLHRQPLNLFLSRFKSRQVKYPLSTNGHALSNSIISLLQNYDIKLLRDPRGYVVHLHDLTIPGNRTHYSTENKVVWKISWKVKWLYLCGGGSYVAPLHCLHFYISPNDVAGRVLS